MSWNVIFQRTFVGSLPHGAPSKGSPGQEMPSHGGLGTPLLWGGELFRGCVPSTVGSLFWREKYRIPTWLCECWLPKKQILNWGLKRLWHHSLSWVTDSCSPASHQPPRSAQWTCWTHPSPSPQFYLLVGRTWHLQRILTLTTLSLPSASHRICRLGRVTRTKEFCPLLFFSALSLKIPTTLLSKYSLYQWWVNKDMGGFTATPNLRCTKPKPQSRVSQL